MTENLNSFAKFNNHDHSEKVNFIKEEVKNSKVKDLLTEKTMNHL